MRTTCVGGVPRISLAQEKKMALLFLQKGGLRVVVGKFRCVLPCFGFSLGVWLAVFGRGLEFPVLFKYARRRLLYTRETADGALATPLCDNEEKKT